MTAIQRDFVRVPAALVEAARKFQASILADVGGRRGTLGGRIQPLVKSMKVAGPAFTVEVRPGDHVRLRESLGLLTRPVADELESDRIELAAWMAELRRVGLLSDGEADSEQIVLALYRYLGRTPSRLLGVALTDAVGDRRTQNQPGTTDEYPNWRVPLTGPNGRQLTLEDVFTDQRAATLAEAVRAQIAPPSG